MNITKLAILTLFSYFQLSAMEFSEQALIKPNAQRIRNEAIIACNNLGKVKVYHDDGTFKVKHNKAVSTVASHDTDSSLRKLNSDQLHVFLEKGAIKVKQLNNGDFTINAYNRGLGGGAGGAFVGAAIGKFTVHFVSQLAIGTATAGVFIVAGPIVAASFASAAEATAFPFIEAASVTVALAGGIAGGVATGPV